MLKSLFRFGPIMGFASQILVSVALIGIYQESKEVLYLFLGAGISIVILFLSYRIKTFLEAIPTSKIRSVAIGLSEIKGKTTGEAKVISPLTKTKCYAYLYQERHKQHINRSRMWVTTNSDRKDGYFYLDDGTGQLLCDTKGATLDLPMKVKNSFNVQKTEIIITPDTNVFVIGHVKDNPFVKDATSTEGWRDLMMGDGEIFLISNKSEKNLRKWYTATVVLSGLSSFGLAIAGFLL